MEPTELLTPPPGPPPPDEPPPRRELWPWLLVLGLLVLAGAAAAWYATRDTSGASAGPQTILTTVAAKPKPKTTRATTTTAPTVVQVTVPDIVGQTKTDALNTLGAAGLNATVNEVPSNQEKDIVVAQAPAGGTEVDKDSSVAVNVSKGKEKPAEPATVAVPNVVGESQHSAERAIKGAGLRPSTQHVPSEQDKNTVVSQSPSGGSSAQKGAGVLLNISEGPPKAKKSRDESKSNDNQQASATTVPGVTGESQPSATADLSAAGFRVSSVDQPTDDPTMDGVVIDQSPPGGNDADPGSTVTIYVGRYSTG